MEELKKITIESPEISKLSIPVPIDLYTVYQNGWWITEIFGSNAVLVKPRKRKKDGFRLCERKITVEQITPKAHRFIEKIAKQQWEIHKKRMLNY